MRNQQNWKTELFFFIENGNHPDLAETVRMEPSQSGWTILIILTDRQACSQDHYSKVLDSATLCSAPLCSALLAPCMDMHGSTLVYIYI